VKNKRIVIIGAGPAGLGAAYRLKDLGYENFIVFEKNNYVGGLCASFLDAGGFTWNLGGHVVFSHYDYFECMLNSLFGSELLDRVRDAWIFTQSRWIPYPLQDYIRYLPLRDKLPCVISLIKARAAAKISRKNPRNFKEWIIATFGTKMAYYFLLPYNSKVWAYPLEEIGNYWVSDRIKIPRLGIFLRNLINDSNDTGWGHNLKFKFPLFGGVGEIFKRISLLLDGKISLNSEVVKINSGTGEICLADGKKEGYDILVNTSALGGFLTAFSESGKDMLAASAHLKHNGVLVIGLGLIKNKCLDNKSWVYFPDGNVPFFRVSFLSNYSPNITPDSGRYYSILCEVAYSKYRETNKDDVFEQTICGLIDSGILQKEDRKFIVSRFFSDIGCAYPIPTRRRDEALRCIQPGLEKMDIFSRGRFGAWKYEVGNMDHSFMQGVEVVNRILREENENIWAL
jgi:protoporphyrinogen oxidase